MKVPDELEEDGYPKFYREIVKDIKRLFPLEPRTFVDSILAVFKSIR